MLSILIATYNYNVKNLVTELHKQCCTLAIEFEILIADDCSSFEFHFENQKLAEKSCVSYWQMPQNVGRAAIRNKLASCAQFPYLLFLDCDAEISNSQFIANYISKLHENCVICGGVDYQKNKPETDKQLRWKYGVKREKLSAAKRINAKKGLTTFNFLIDKKIITHFVFNETIRNYGYEDTLLEYTLIKHNYTITHIDNSAVHAGLDENATFLKKVEESLHTLLHISNTIAESSKNKSIEANFLQYIKIYRIYEQCKKYNLCFIVRMQFRVTRTLLQYCIVKKNAPLWALDLYKLGYFCNLKHNAAHT